MRCRCCDKKLSDFEATRKSINTNEYLDMCNKCYNTISNQVLSYERYDLYDDEDEQDTPEQLDMDYVANNYHTRGVDNDL
jgi:hypothetical protein